MLCVILFPDHFFSWQEFFEIMLHYKRIEKLEFGGTKGKLYSEHAAKMHKEFSDLCQALIHSKNCPLDLNSQVILLIN